MDETPSIPDLAADDLRAVAVVTDLYAFTWTRGADGSTSTTYTPITETTPDRGAGATVPKENHE